MGKLNHVPVIDVSDFRSGVDLDTAAGQVDAALRDIGFFIVAGHGVPDAALSRVKLLSRRFFDLPLAQRLSVHNTVEGAFRGYVAEGDETFSYTLDTPSAHDLKESFVIGQFQVDETDYYTSGPAGHAFAPNVYPLEPAGLQSAYESYYRHMEDLVALIMRIFAQALSLPHDFFVDKFDRHASTLRTTSYPKQTRVPEPGQLRAGEHTDYGAVTILAIEDRPGGLEVRTVGGDWITVPAIADTFVVNIGDLMMNWSNDFWLSNLHRVVNPPLIDDESTRRQSVVYFANPNYDATIECLPGRLKPGEQPKYPAVTAGEHRLAKIRKSAQS